MTIDRVSKLFGGPAPVRLMRWFLFHPNASFAASALKEKARLDSTDARKALTTLSAAGFLRKKGSGRYALNNDFPHIASLRELLVGELSLSVNLAARFRPVGTIKLLCAAGIFIDSTESRTDLLVVGDKLNPKILQRAIATLESDVGADIRYTALSTEEFMYRMGVRDKLVRDIMDYPHLTFINRLVVENKEE